MTMDRLGSTSALLAANGPLQAFPGRGRLSLTKVRSHGPELAKELTAFAIVFAEREQLANPRFPLDQGCQHAKLPRRPVLGSIRQQRMPRKKPQVRRDAARMKRVMV